jgi:DNA-binding response OmpR family regulator
MAVSSQRTASTPPPASAAGRILVVDDAPGLRLMLRSALTADGFEVREASDAATALAELADAPTDLVLLDLGLPDQDGSELLRELQRVDDVAVIVLTGQGRTEVRDAVFAAGADDYITKPYDDTDVLARVRAVLRRTRRSSDPRVRQHGALRVDLLAREVSVDGTPVLLTRREFDLLAHLAVQPRVAVSREQCLREVWRSSGDWQDPDTVTEHVRRIRNKLADAGLAGEPIVTVRGVGYRFDPPSTG